MISSANIEQSVSQEKIRANAGSEISKVSVTAIVLTASVVGCWASACLFAGTVASGGPVSLIQNLLHTIIG